MIYSIKNLPYDQRLRTLKLPSLIYRRRRGDMIQIFYKIMEGLVNIDNTLLFIMTKLEDIPIKFTNHYQLTFLE